MPKTPPLSLDDFRLSRITLPVDRFAQRAPEAAEMLHAATSSVQVYRGGSWLVRLTNGTFWAVLGNDEVAGRLPEVEAALYFDWYASECCSGEWSLDGLTGLLADYCAHHRIEHRSADEMLYDCAAEHFVFIAWFCSEWEATETAETELLMQQDEHIRAAAALRFTLDYAEEIGHPMTVEALDELRADFCRFFRLTQRPVTDLLATARATRSEHVPFLNWLQTAYEEACAREAIAIAERQFRANPEAYEG